MSAPYRDAAPDYLAAGWAGVLPVGDRPRQKAWPPAGYTGRDGADPDPATVEDWRRVRGNCNVALRLPPGVVGVDVDAYGDKPGEATLAAVEAAHGPLPPTWISGSREGASGIRLYRSAVEPTAGGAGPGIDVIAAHHRYALVPPSVHPEGRPYRWRAPDGTDTLPRPDELPLLPAGWVDHLAGRCSCGRTNGDAITPTSGDPVADKLAEARAALAAGGSRHEAVAGPALALVGFRKRGFPGAARALEELHVAFLAAVTAPGEGRRSVPSAEAEWRRMTENGRAGHAGEGYPPYEPMNMLFVPGELEPDRPADPWPAPPAAAAYHGPAGELALALAPHTEADPVAILGSLLAIFGALAGGPAIYQGGAQAANLYVVLAGDTSTGRKGTSFGVVRPIVGRAYPEWEELLVPGLGSGEALVAHLKRAGDGSGDVRALVLETELGRLLSVLARDGSTLSPVLRDGFDGVPMGRFLAREEMLVPRHHVGLLAHVTPAELRAKLAGVEAANGFGNRFLFLAVRRSHLVPLPQRTDGLAAPLIEPLHRAIVEAVAPRELSFTDAAADRWEAVYADLALRPRHGLAGTILARGEAHLARLALVYALLDRAPAVDVAHLEAAVALWDYAERSARFLFGDSTGNRLADAIRRWLADGPLTREALRRESGVRLAVELDEAIDLLVSLGLVTTARGRSGPEGGRRPVVVSAVSVVSAQCPRAETGAR